MKKKWQKIKDFDKAFDDGKTEVDFSEGTLSEGMSKSAKIPPFNIPSWLNMEIEFLSQKQANSKASVIRQLLVEAVETKKKQISGI